MRGGPPHILLIRPHAWSARELGGSLVGQLLFGAQLQRYRLYFERYLNHHPLSTGLDSACSLKLAGLTSDPKHPKAHHLEHRMAGQHWPVLFPCNGCRLQGHQQKRAESKSIPMQYVNYNKKTQTTKRNKNLIHLIQTSPGSRLTIQITPFSSTSLRVTMYNYNAHTQASAMDAPHVFAHASSRPLALAERNRPVESLET